MDDGPNQIPRVFIFTEYILNGGAALSLLNFNIYMSEITFFEDI